MEAGEEGGIRTGEGAEVEEEARQQGKKEEMKVEEEQQRV